MGHYDITKAGFTRRPSGGVRPWPGSSPSGSALGLDHAVAAQRARLLHGERAARATWGGRVLGPFASPTAVAALNHQLGTDQPHPDPVRRPDEGLPARRHGHVGVDPAADLGACSGRRSGTRRSSRCSRSSSSCRSSILGGVVAALKEGTHARPGDHGRRPVGDGDPRLRLGGRPADRVLARPRDLPVDRRVARRLGRPHADQVPAAAGVLPRVRAVRLHRADGAGGHDRGARRRLHADRGHQGAAAAHGALRATCCATRCCRRSRSSRRRSAT